MAAEVNTFSHLESLLLFQSVATHGNTADAFARISKSLRNSQLLQRQPDANVDRLNPDALTGLYLRLLKAEAKRALAESTAASVSALTESNDASSSKSNGIPSPQLATIEDATPHRHLEPLMIDKLYALYKDQMTEEIKADESRYDRLVQEVQGLESLSVSASNRDGIYPQSTRGPAAASNEDDSSLTKSSVTPADQTPDQSLPSKHVNSQATATYGDDADAVTASTLNHTDIKQSLLTTASETSATPKRIRDSSKTADSGQMSLDEKPRTGTPRPQAATSTQNAADAADKSSQLPNSSQISSVAPSTAAKHASPSPQPNQPPAVPPNTSQSTLAKRSGGMQLPPFQVSPQVPLQNSKASSVEPRAAGLDNRTASPGTQTPSSIKSSTKAPLASLLQEGQGVHYSPGSSTGWKVTPGMPDAATPRPRSISPLSERDSSPDGRASKRRRTTRGTANAEPSKPKSSAKATSQTPSMAATSSRGRTRSQSVGSHGDDASVQSAPTATVKRPKPEASTPAVNLNPPLTTRSGRATRNTPVPAAGPTAASPQPTTISKTSTKRKRDSTNETDVSGPPTPAPLDQPSETSHSKPTIKTEAEPDSEPPNTIRASRSFHKASAPILNNIGSHKHASLFSQPVSTRTKGYYDIIKRPTDLNTIRKGIHAGIKAVNAAVSSAISSTNVPTAGSPAAAATSSSDLGGAGGPAAQPPTPGGDPSAHTVVLPYSHELVPPEGIVNSAQLEQEIMRMFANAVMFNEGDDGVVADTREMFNEVEGSVAAWKQAQSSSE